MAVTEALKLLIEVDERGAVRGIDSVSTSLKSSTKAVEGFDKSLDRVSTSSGRVGKAVTGTGKSFDGYHTRLTRVGDAADTLDTRFGGLSDGITGVSALMEAGSLAPQQMALAFADLGSAASTTVIPSIKNVGRGLAGLKGLATGTGKVLDGDLVGGLARASKGAGGLGTGISNLVGKLGGMRNILVGGGIVAGLVGIVAGIKALESAAQAREWEHFIESLQSGQQKIDETSGKALLMATAFGNLDGLLKKVAAEGGPVAAEQLVQLAEKMNLPASAIATLKGQLHDLGGSFESARIGFGGLKQSADDAEESIRAVTDATRAQFDPIFAATSAQTALSEALAQQSEVYKDSESSAQDKARADAAVKDAAVDLDVATQELNTKIRNGTIDVERASAEFVDMAIRMGIPKAEARRLGDQIFGATQRSQELGRQRPTPVLRVQDLASGQIRAVQGLIRNFGGTTATATLRLAVIGLQEANRAAALRQSFQHGGVVKGPKGSPQLVLAHGGETVVPTHSPSEMARFGTHLSPGAGGGSGLVTVNVNLAAGAIVSNDPQAVAEGLIRHVRRNGASQILRALGG